jgi:UDPglucose 6-dehydrogenase
MDRARQILGSRIKYAADPYVAAKGADALLILTEWKEFANLDLLRITRLLRSPIVLDGRNVFSQAEMAEAGLSYHSIGRPALEASRSLLKKGQSAI